MSFSPMRYSQPVMSSAPAEAGERAGDRHREEVVARDGDAAVARRLGVEADRAHLEAERRAVDDDPVDDEHRDRDEDADREPLQQLEAPEDRQLRALDDVVRDRDRRPGEPCSGPPWPKRYAPTQIAIQLSMIVEITSCAPTVALRMPAMPAQAAPASAPTTRQSITCSERVEAARTTSRARRRRSCRRGTGPGRRC